MTRRTPRTLLHALEEISAPLDAPLPAVGSARTAPIRRLRELSLHRNIVGIGISEKTTDDETTGELSLCFYVRKKVQLSKLSGNQVVPPFLCISGDRGCLTDIKEIGACQLHHGFGLQSGISVSHATSPAGTIGAIVRRAGKLCILSNAHVLARSGKARLGDAILAPGTTDGGSLPGDVVARLVAFAPLDGPGDKRVDAAVAEILPDKAAGIDTDIPGASIPRRTAKALRGMEVIKTGKASQTTRAHVIDEHFRTLLRYPGLGLVRFVDQILCTSFAESGDSGALVIAATSGHVVGLHFSGNAKVSICNPINDVVGALAISFAT